MKTRNLTLLCDELLAQDSAPQIVSHYRNAHIKIFGRRPYVHKTQYSLFRVLEDDLRDAGYSSWEYAQTVVRILRRWAHSKGLDCVPVKVFCGDWAYGKFKRVAGSKYVNISNDDTEHMLYHNELTVAKTYIDAWLHDEAVRLSDVVESLRPLLAEQWLRRYDSGGKRPVCDVIGTLCEEYGIDGTVRNYNDIVDALA